MRRALCLAVLVLTACGKPEPPKITPHSAKVTSVSPMALNLALELDVMNPNRFPLVVRDVSGKFAVGDGVEVGVARSQPNGTIPARGSARVPADLAVRWTNLGAMLPLATGEKPVPYRFQGVATVGGESLNVDVPFVIKGELTREQVLAAGLRGLGNLLPPPPAP